MAHMSFQPDESQQASMTSAAYTGAKHVQDAHSEIVETLKIWLLNHPAPDQPVMSVASYGAFSPRELYEAVESRNQTGEFLESLIAFGASSRSGGISEILQSFRDEDSSSDIDKFSIETPK